MALGVVLLIVNFVCTIIILIDAFRNEIWKGSSASSASSIPLLHVCRVRSREEGLCLLGFWGGMILGYVLIFMGGVSAKP